MRFAAPVALCLIATACGSPERGSDPAPSNGSSAAVDPGPTEPLPPEPQGEDKGAASGNDDGEDRISGGLTLQAPQPDAPPGKVKQAFFDWTGRFAASPNLCSGGAWNFARNRISTAGETSCNVDETRDQGDRATLFLSCTAEGMKTKEVWTLIRQGEGMSVRRDSGKDVVNVKLSRCR